MTVEADTRTEQPTAACDTGGVGEVSRRNALRSSVAVVGVVAALSRLDDTPSLPTSAVPTPSAPQPGVHRLSLHTDDLLGTSRVVLLPGQSTTTSATLAGDVNGLLVSTLTALTVASGTATMVSEQQVIMLPDATLVGAGVRVLGDDTAVFAIVGGTGRFRGARGEYTVVGSHAANGGTGSASYDFTIHVDSIVDTTAIGPTTEGEH